MAFSSGSFNVLEPDRAASAGRSTSTAKKRAARQNGKKGGRPHTRTLGEFLLRQKLNKDQHNAIREAVFRLTSREQKWFKDYFGLPKYYPELGTTDFTLHRQKPGAEMQHIITKFRLMARYLLSEWRSPARMPKNYVVIRVPKHAGEREGWEQRHPNMPFVATRPEKRFFKRMGPFKHLSLLLSKNPNRVFTVEDVKDMDKALTTEAAEALLAYLRFKHKPS
jgi:hypothetical protein